jgi:hypothetical protein
MPNDSRSRRDKREKEKKRKDKKSSKPLRRKDTHADEALTISVSQILGGMAVTRKGNPGSEALDNSLSSFASLSSSAEAKGSSNGEKNSPPSYKEDEDGGSLSRQVNL